VNYKDREDSPLNITKHWVSVEEYFAHKIVFCNHVSGFLVSTRLPGESPGWLNNRWLAVTRLIVLFVNTNRQSKKIYLLSQSLMLRPSADQGARRLTVRDCFRGLHPLPSLAHSRLQNTSHCHAQKRRALVSRMSLAVRVRVHACACQGKAWYPLAATRSHNYKHKHNAVVSLMSQWERLKT